MSGKRLAILIVAGTVVALGAQTEHRGGGRYTTERLTRPIPPEMQNLTDPALNGAIDIHFHVGPDSYPRSIDALDAAKLAKSRGMRGAVLKHHFSQTAGLAYLARKAAPAFEAFGGIALNTPVGGLNVEAIRHMIEIEGGYGKVVWMPTHDGESEGKAENRPYVIVSKDGALIPEAKAVIAFVKEHQLTLETGHSTPAEQLMIIREAKQQGVRHIIVTHEGNIPGPMTTAQLKEAASLGAFIEVCTTGITAANAKTKIDRIRELGPEHVIISSDVGLLGAPLHPDSLAFFAKALRAAGVSEHELDLMYKNNPASALGLPLYKSGPK
jgi:Family of unknown function (DUF6282)